jgi:ketosteroid isomerase-like protein
MRDQNMATVEALYQAFSSGNVPRMLATLSEDVVWTQPGTTRLSKVHRGREAVVGFFLDIAQYGRAVRPIEYFSRDEKVLAVVDVELAGERANEVDRFDLRNGLIMAVEHIGDTEMLSRALSTGCPR